MLPNGAPIIVTWVPRKIGATLPDGENSKLNYVDILIKHKQENNEERDILLFVNGPGFEPGQIEELKDKFKEEKGIHVIDLFDSKYDRYWEEIDQGWQINGKPISIKEYYRNMYNMQDEDRTYFAIVVDTFRDIAAYFLLREQEELQKDLGVIYTDFDSLSAINNHVGKDITIPKGILLGTTTIIFHDEKEELLSINPEHLEFFKTSGCSYDECKIVDVMANNDLIAINDPNIIIDILSKYKGKILNQKQICNEVKECLSSITDEKLYSLAEKIIKGDKETRDVAVSEWKEGMKKCISNFNRYGIKALYDINNFRYITNSAGMGANINLAHASITSLVTSNIINEKVSESVLYSYGCQNGNYNCFLGASDLSWLEEIYTQDELLSKQPDNPSTQIDVIALLLIIQIV